MLTRDAERAGRPDQLDMPSVACGTSGGELIAYQIGQTSPGLCRASNQRPWMEDSFERFAYRCLPLVIANQLGWDILNPVPFRARWLRGPAPNDVQVESVGDGQSRPWASGHFGEGVLTFSVGYLFRTPPGARLLVTGPLNWPKPCLYPLSGVVETDWTHASFTMNYKFTRPGEWVEFAQEEPFCRIVPLSLALVEDVQGRIRTLSDEPHLHDLYHQWSQSRDEFNRQLSNPFSEDHRRGWQKDYFQGQGADGQRQQGHQTKLNHREFIDERGGGAMENSRDRTKGRQRHAPQVALANAYDFLWRESRPFETRCRRSVQVLSAIAQTIGRIGAPDGSEQVFLASYRRFHEASSEAFTQVCLEPRAYFWTRVCFQLMDAVTNGRELSPLANGYCRALGAVNARQALSLHLCRFAEFELAAALLDGRDWSGQIKRPATEPWSIPASPWTIASSADMEVRSLTGGELSGLEQERPWRLALVPPRANHEPEPLRLSECPVLDDGGCSIRLQPAALAGLGMTATQSAIGAGDLYQAQHADLIRDALGAIRRYTPDVFKQIRDYVRIIGLKPARPGEYSNLSVSQLPGAMLLTVIPHPLVMADRIIHEFHHHRLFSVEDGDALLEPDTAGQRFARFYSPWRDDLRPIRGVLHGLYVFIAVGRFWLAVYKAADRPADQPYVLDQLVRIGKQLSLARDVLASHARFTPIGEGAFEQLTADIAALHEEMRRAGLPDDTPALLVTDAGEFQPQRSPVSDNPLTVARAINEHLVRFEA